jgi:hypothetical protein
MKIRNLIIIVTVIVVYPLVTTLAQETKPSSEKAKSPGEITAASKLLAAKDANCRANAKMRKLTFLQRRRVIRECMKRQ